MSDVLPGAEAWAADGGSTGVLVVHGFTGSPGSMRGVAEAAAAAGHTVELPRLPGHGTSLDDMLTTGWADWSAAAEAAFTDLAARVEKVIVLGLSMGGSLTLWLGTRHPEIAGLVCVNPAVVPLDDATLGQMAEIADGGTPVLPGIGSDIAKEGEVEIAYDGMPVRPLLSMQAGLAEFHAGLGDVDIPLLLCTSPEDHVVPPSDSDHLASVWSGEVERVTLENSFHVATQDNDQGLIIERTLAFIERVTS